MSTQNEKLNKELHAKKDDDSSWPLEINEAASAVEKAYNELLYSLERRPFTVEGLEAAKHTLTEFKERLMFELINTAAKKAWADKGVYLAGRSIAFENSMFGPKTEPEYPKILKDVDVLYQDGDFFPWPDTGEDNDLRKS